jgi:hypothetical protein
MSRCSLGLHSNDKRNASREQGGPCVNLEANDHALPLQHCHQLWGLRGAQTHIAHVICFTSHHRLWGGGTYRLMQVMYVRRTSSIHTGRKGPKEVSTPFFFSLVSLILKNRRTLLRSPCCLSVCISVRVCPSIWLSVCLRIRGMYPHLFLIGSLWERFPVCEPVSPSPFC